MAKQKGEHAHCEEGEKTEGHVKSHGQGEMGLPMQGEHNHDEFEEHDHSMKIGAK